MPKISCLVCVHSTSRHNDGLLLQAVESLMYQTRQVDELVVVCDACHPETEPFISQYLSERSHRFGDIKVLSKPNKEGLAVAKNFGLEHCTGEYVTYCDADDAWLTCKLQVQEEYQQRVGSKFTFTEAWDNYGSHWMPNCFQVGQYQTHEQIAAALPHENVLCHGSAMIHLLTLRALGGYPTGREHLGREDWSLWQKALASGQKFAKVPERLYVYGMGTSVAR